jgi:hypothetical protein
VPTTRICPGSTRPDGLVVAGGLRRLILGAVTAFVLLMASGVAASAYWTVPELGRATIAPGGNGLTTRPVTLDEPLAPGRSAPLTVMVHNGGREAVALDGVAATELRAVTEGSGASCGSRYLRLMLDEPAGRVVQAGASAELPIRFTLADDAPQGCQGRSFTIRAFLRARTDR